MLALERALIACYPHRMFETPEDRPIYRLLTGKDDRAFCERVSEAIAQGWRLHGSPTMCWEPNEGYMKVGQVVIWKDAPR